MNNIIKYYNYNDKKCMIIFNIIIIIFYCCNVLVLSTSSTNNDDEEENISIKQTTNNNINAIVLAEHTSCRRQRYYVAENVNDCRVLLDKALEQNKIESNIFNNQPIDTLSATDYPIGCIVDYQKKKIFFNKRSSSRTACSSRKTCLCWRDEPTCALNITYFNNKSTIMNDTVSHHTKQIFTSDKDERCYCCSRPTEEADLICERKAVCESNVGWSIFASILWIIIQIFCCCFLPVTLIIVYCNRRKNVNEGRRVYVTREYRNNSNNNNNSTEMQTIRYNNANRRNRNGRNYRIETAQVIEMSNLPNNHHVIQAIPIGRPNRRQQQSNNIVMLPNGNNNNNNNNNSMNNAIITPNNNINNNINNALPPAIHIQPVQNQQQQQVMEQKSQ